MSSASSHQKTSALCLTSSHRLTSGNSCRQALPVAGWFLLLIPNGIHFTDDLSPPGSSIVPRALFVIFQTCRSSIATQPYFCAMALAVLNMKSLRTLRMRRCRWTIFSLSLLRLRLGTFLSKSAALPSFASFCFELLLPSSCFW